MSEGKTSANSWFEINKIPMMIVGAIIAAAMAWVMSAKNDKISRLDKQIENFYGPLTGVITTNTTYWSSFCEENCPYDDGFFGDDNSEINDVRVWRNYINTRAIPEGEEAIALIKKHQELVLGADYPEVFTNLINHIGEYRQLQRSWENDGSSICPKGPTNCESLLRDSNIANQPWPRNLLSCVVSDLENLKKERERVRASFVIFDRSDIPRSEICDQ
jgi:hypothetical protein